MSEDLEWEDLGFTTREGKKVEHYTCWILPDPGESHAYKMYVEYGDLSGPYVELYINDTHERKSFRTLEAAKAAAETLARALQQVFCDVA